MSILDIEPIMLLCDCQSFVKQSYYYYYYYSLSLALTKKLMRFTLPFGSKGRILGLGLGF